MQMVSARPVHAQTVTGCSPVVSITLIQTGNNCECVPLPTSNRLLQQRHLLLGPGPDGGLRSDVPGRRGGSWPARIPGHRQAPDCPDRIAEFPCSGGKATFRARFPVTCPDGGTYVFDGQVTADCVPCPLEDPPLPITRQAGCSTTRPPRRRPKRGPGPRARHSPDRRSDLSGRRTRATAGGLSRVGRSASLPRPVVGHGRPSCGRRRPVGRGSGSAVAAIRLVAATGRIRSCSTWLV